MSIEQAFLFLLALCYGVLGWFARELYTATQSLRRDLSSLETRIGTDYVRYDRLQDRLKEALEPIKEGIDEIKASLIHKVDK